MSTCTVSDIIDKLRCEILDPYGDIWSDKLLTDFIQQAYTHIAALRPDVFSETKEILLERGKCFQSICDECTRIVEVLTIDGQDCFPPDKESSQDNLNSLNQYFSPFDCKTTGTNPDGTPVIDPFVPNSYTLIESSDCSFRLSEPTPDDRDVYALVSCVIDVDFCPPSGIEIELPEKICNRFYEGFKHLILSKIYATDRKADNLMELSQIQFKYWQDFRDWLFRTDFANSQSDWHLYRQKTTGRDD